MLSYVHVGRVGSALRDALGVGDRFLLPYMVNETYKQPFNHGNRACLNCLLMFDNSLSGIVACMLSLFEL